MSEIQEKGRRARAAGFELARLTRGQKDAALQKMARRLLAECDYLIAENAKDLENGRQQGVSSAMLDRLLLNSDRIGIIAESLAALAALADPVGEVLSSWERPNGLRIEKVRVPLGVIGIIYEARPNVTVDASALCLKTGNAALLRGSSSAINSNKALVAVLQNALKTAGLPPDAVLLIEDTARESVEELLRLNRYVDVIIPRGGAGLINYVVQNAAIPVLETGAGNCHVYIDRSARAEVAIPVTVNAKAQRPSVCNAAETVLVQRDWAREHLPQLISALEDRNVECRGCEETRALVPHIKAAGEEDWATEYLDLIIAIKVVSGVDEAVQHINTYGTRHSESIISEDQANVDTFFADVDAAALYHNASTRFTDGFEFGFGAEIGISTQKLHARGPVGLPELTSYKYLVRGTGQVRG